MRNPNRPTRRLAGAASTAALAVALLLPSPAFAQHWYDPVVNGFSFGFDLLILRPFGVATVVVGAAAFVPIAIITSPHGIDGIREAQEQFINEPVRNVFLTPLWGLSGE